MRLCLWSSLLCCLCSECLIKKSCEWGKKKNQTATKTLVDFPIFFNLLELLCLPATVSLQMSYFTRHSMFSSASTLIQFSPVRFCSINGNLEVLCCYYCFYYCCFVCVCVLKWTGWLLLLRMHFSGKFSDGASLLAIPLLHLHILGWCLALLALPACLCLFVFLACV